MNNILKINRTLIKASTLLYKNSHTFNFVRNYSLPKMGLPLKSVLETLEKIAPIKLAESWDNVGLLVEPNSNLNINTVLLTIDLTEDVVDEAIEEKAELIITYHPNIFSPLKAVSQRTWKERIVVKCLQNNIAIFSPHTSWDAIAGGVNDWLASAFKASTSKAIKICDETNPQVGMGRLLTLQQPISLNNAINAVKKITGLQHVRVGVAKHKDLESLISTVALCAGSGNSVLSGVQADLYLTGEMLHHDVLDAAQKGIHVILCNHSDSERGFLKIVAQKIEGVKVVVSKVDKDCLTTI